MRKYIPNTITCCNLLSGCVAVFYAFIHQPEMALTWIIIGAVFDFFDGMSARLLNVSSPIGKELDSLADVVTFGVAPSTILFSQLRATDALSGLGENSLFLAFTAYLMAAFSALRLAKFNLDERQTTSFIGLPTPANALFWGSFLISNSRCIASFPYMVVLLFILLALSCWLLISEIPMFALKFKKWAWKGNELRYGFIAFAGLVLITNMFVSGLQGFLNSWWMVIAAYIVLSVIITLKGAGKKPSVIS